MPELASRIYTAWSTIDPLVTSSIFLIKMVIIQASSHPKSKKKKESGEVIILYPISGH
jgi:hypothetical protein